MASAERLLIVTSRSYTRRLRENINGNIAEEIAEVTRRIGAATPPKIVVLAVDDWRDAEANLPWTQLGKNGADFLGAVPLQAASDAELERAVRAALQAFEAQDNA